MKTTNKTEIFVDISSWKRNFRSRIHATFYLIAYFSVNLQKSSDSILKRILDVFISILLELCVVMAWHGLWTIEDKLEHKFNHSNAKTAFISLSTGILTFSIISLIQFPYAQFVQDTQAKSQKFNFQWFQIRIFSVIINLLGFISTVNTFRGYWYLQDEYFLPGKYEINAVLIH